MLFVFQWFLTPTREAQSSFLVTIQDDATMLITKEREGKAPNRSARIPAPAAWV